MSNIISSDEEIRGEHGKLSAEELQDLQRRFDLIEVNGVRLFVDSKTDVPVQEGEQRVYPFTDEGEELLSIAKKVVGGDHEAFDRIVDCFSGGGNSMLPLLHAGIAKCGFGIDLNPRAVQLAQKNAALNDLGQRATFMREDVNNLTTSLTETDGRTLYIANPPFALTTQEKGQSDIDLPGNDTSTHLMRAGGRDGLKLTRAYITQSLAKAYVQNTMEGAKVGDTIIGVAYSRIRQDGGIELEDMLKEASEGKASYEIELVEGAPLWRGPNGKKEQPNPMPLSSMNIKGVTPEQKQEYDTAAANHLQEGYDRLGYFRYILRIGKTQSVVDQTRSKTGETLQA